MFYCVTEDEGKDNVNDSGAKHEKGAAQKPFPLGHNKGKHLFPDTGRHGLLVIKIFVISHFSFTFV
jgi:hypothetical protein